MTVHKELIERPSGVYEARIIIEGPDVVIAVRKAVGGVFNYTAEAITTADRLRAFNDPERIVKDTIDLLIKRIEGAVYRGQTRV